MFARLSQDRQLIEWLQARTAKHLADLGRANRDNFEKIQGMYQASNELYMLVSEGARTLDKIRGNASYPNSPIPSTSEVHWTTK